MSVNAGGRGQARVAERSTHRLQRLAAVTSRHVLQHDDDNPLVELIGPEASPLRLLG